MASRRALLSGTGALLAAVSGAAVQRPPGVPLGPFGADSTAAEVTAGLDLSGTAHLVTGATSGLGLESARVLARRGAQVIATGRTLDKAAQAVRGLPGRARRRHRVRQSLR